MSKTKIPPRTLFILWAQSAGRCEYDGCNVILYEDLLTKVKSNYAYVAHIVADEPGGPRGDAVRSSLLAKEISNLMLLCDVHHRLIDRDDVAGHPEERLLRMKHKHEERIRLLTEIKDEKRSNVVLYGSNIGRHDTPLNLNCANEGLVPFRFPAEASCIELSLKNNASEDHTPEFWETEVKNLERLFERKITLQRAERSVKHYSVFGLAAQPLLIKLGTLFGDIFPADVYQLKKEPESTWAWFEDDSSIVNYIVNRPEHKTDTVALKFSLSAKISDARITKVLGDDCSIWELTTNNPHNDFIRRKEHLSEYKTIVRSLLDEIKLVHGEDVKLHIFPVMPVSANIELGRVWNPKSQLPLVLYDQNRKTGGFTKAFEIEHR